MQKVFLTFSPQQSPPSHSHPILLFSSSQKLSPFCQDFPQPDSGVEVGVATEVLAGVAAELEAGVVAEVVPGVVMYSLK